MAKAPTLSPKDKAAIAFAETLQPRHREWIKQGAAINRETAGTLLERIVRMAYAADHGKNGSRGGATILAKDFPDQ